MEVVRGLKDRLFKAKPSVIILPPPVASNFALNETHKEVYLSSLTDQDRSRVVGLTEFLGAIQDELDKVRLGVLAVGSKLRPQEYVYHPVEDLDLRVLLEAPTMSPLREHTVSAVRYQVREYLSSSNIDFEEADETTECRMVDSISWDPETRMQTEGLAPYLDWYNNDPSFTTKPVEGLLPLHISISGVDNPSLDDYMDFERSSKNYFAVLLYQSS